MKKTRLIVVLIVLLTLLTSISIIFGEEEFPEPLMEKARVLEAGESEYGEDLYSEFQMQEVKVEILSGKYKGTVLNIENHLPDNEAYSIFVKKGDKVVVMIEEDDSGYDVYIADYHRSNYTLFLVILAGILVLVIGRTKGLKAIISLSLTVAAIIYILLPQILKGVDPILLSIIIAIGITVITIFLVGGINSKSLSAIIGTTVGVVIAGVIAYIVGTKAHLTGLSAEEATMLLYIPQEVTFNFRSLLFAGIILGSLGAVMDVGMSISSSIDEIYNANKNLSIKELFNAGMNVGKDIMGTMINTLILAYAGTSIPLLLVFMAYETSLTKVFNLDVIATEIVRSLSGSIGLILTIPITALVASTLLKRTNKKDKGEEQNG